MGKIYYLLRSRGLPRQYHYPRGRLTSDSPQRALPITFACALFNQRQRGWVDARGKALKEKAEHKEEEAAGREEGVQEEEEEEEGELEAGGKKKRKRRNHWIKRQDNDIFR